MSSDKETVVEPEAIVITEIDTVIVESVPADAESEPLDATAADEEQEKTFNKKSPSFHRRPNSESFHLVKDPLTLHHEKVSEDDPDAEKSASFHLRPKSETFHVVKDPLTLK